jgi:hypothetical protein
MNSRSNWFSAVLALNRYANSLRCSEHTDKIAIAAAA